MSNNIISESQIQQVLGKEERIIGKNGKEYHSASERRYVEEITSISMPEIQKELNDRIVIQHVDFKTNKPIFNAFNKKVLIRDENGERILIDNHQEIGKMVRKLSNEKNPEPKNIPKRLEMNGIEVPDSDIDSEFDFD